MNEPKRIIRGELVFETKDNLVVCTLGEPTDPESEPILAIDASYLPDLIAGLTAMVKKKT